MDPEGADDDKRPAWLTCEDEDDVIAFALRYLEKEMQILEEVIRAWDENDCLKRLDAA